MEKSKLQELAFQRIDQANQQDPNQEEWAGQQYPKEYLYGLRMSAQLERYDPEASAPLQIAARAQHICRWEIPRDSFPKTRLGYNQWRNKLRKFHASKTEEILQDLAYELEFIERVKFLILKKQLKLDSETQALEDVICLVFLEFYFEAFAKDYTEEKLIKILRKTWAKMSDKGRNMALQLDLSEEAVALVTKALGED